MDNVQTIPAASKLCQKGLVRLQRVVEDSRHSSTASEDLPDEDDLNDVCERFDCWADNLGAFKPSQKQSSLESRLQENPLVRKAVLRLLADLASSIDAATLIAKDERENRTSLGFELSSGEIDSDLESDLSLDEEDFSIEKSEIEETFSAIQDCLGNLFRMAAFIRTPNPESRRQKASKAPRFDRSTDKVHVLDLLSKWRTPPGVQSPVEAYSDVHCTALAAHLGEANARRRQYFLYCREHQERLSDPTHGEDQSYTEDAPSSVNSKSPKPADQNPSPSQPALTVVTRPSIRTTTETVRLSPNAMLPVGLSRPSRGPTPSVVSFTSSVRRTIDSNLSFPPLPSRNLEFICPYCHLPFGLKPGSDKIRQSQWRKHVLKDLEPYVCTFSGCGVETYASKSEWFTHELSTHRFSWACPECDSIWKTSGDLEEHIRGTHHDKVYESQLPAVILQARQHQQSIYLTDCPFCHQDCAVVDGGEDSPSGQQPINMEEFRDHVAEHLLEIALFALPRAFPNTDEFPKDTDETGGFGNLSSRGSLSEFGGFDESEHQPSGISDSAGTSNNDEGAESFEVPFTDPINWDYVRKQIRSRSSDGNLEEDSPCPLPVDSPTNDVPDTLQATLPDSNGSPAASTMGSPVQSGMGIVGSPRRSAVDSSALSTLDTLESIIPDDGTSLITSAVGSPILSSLDAEQPIMPDDVPGVSSDGLLQLHPSSKLCLDDPKRVQKVLDRGEAFRLEIEKHRQASIQEIESSERIAKVIEEDHDAGDYDCDDLVDQLAVKLDKAKISNALEPEKRFIPHLQFAKILTFESVCKIVLTLRCLRKEPDKRALAKDIYYGSSDGSREPAVRLLAVLIGIDRVEDFDKHLKDGVRDSCLPLQPTGAVQDQLLKCRKHGMHGTINNYFRPSIRESFSNWSYTLNAPFIKGGPSLHSHYVLETGDVIPVEIIDKVTQDYSSDTMEKDASSGGHNTYGGFSEVYKVKIHDGHWDFGHHGIRHPQEFFALKKLTSHSRNSFDLELSFLLFTGQNYKKKHLIQLLATFEVVNPAAGGLTTYYLLFDWAEGDLRKFWQNNGSLVGKKSHCIWMAHQFHEICEALQCVHNDRAPTMRYLEDRDSNEDLYGRHGDIKPGNFLWFRSDSFPGLLALSDFGLGRLHTQVSRSKQDPRNLERSASYRCPEFDLPFGQVSPRSDIFSLGCVFLEYVTWFFYGFDAVENVFPGKRMENDIYGFESDIFFSVKNKRAHIKPSVLDWIHQLQRRPNCSWYLWDLLEVIKDGMLEPNSDKRIRANQLTKRMHELLKSCKAEEDYYLGSRWS